MDEKNVGTNTKLDLKTRLIKSGLENEKMLLELCKRFKYTTADLVQSHLNISRTGTYQFLKRIENKGLIKSHIYDNNLCKRKLIGITLQGLNVLESLKPEKEQNTIQENRIFSISKFKESHHNHNYQIQKFCIDVMQYKRFKYRQNIKITGFKLGSEEIGEFRNKKTRLNQKFPDVTLYLYNTETDTAFKHAFEIELTAKSKSRYLEVTWSYKNNLESGKYERVVYLHPKNINSIKRSIMESCLKVSKNTSLNGLSYKSLQEKFKFISLE